MAKENEDFLALCNEFESLVRHVYGLEEKDSPYYYLAGLDEYEDFRETVNFIRGLRNLLVHNRTSRMKEPYVLVQPSLIDQLNGIMNRVENPKRARDIMTVKLVTATPQHKVGTVLDAMRDKDLSRVPILKDGKLVGVFSENTVFRRMVNNHPVDREETLERYLEEISLNHPEQERYMYCSAATPVWQLEEKFFDKNKKRLAAVFVLDKNKKVEGMITIYDLAQEESGE